MACMAGGEYTRTRKCHYIAIILLVYKMKKTNCLYYTSSSTVHAHRSLVIEPFCLCQCPCLSFCLYLSHLPSLSTLEVSLCNASVALGCSLCRSYHVRSILSPFRLVPRYSTLVYSAAGTVQLLLYGFPLWSVPSILVLIPSCMRTRSRVFSSPP